MVSAILLVAMLLSSQPAKPRFIHDRHERVASWTLRIHTDSFAEKVTCRLFKHRIRRERDALSFELGRRVRSFGAVYRIDDKPPRKASDDAADLAHMGLALANDDLGNPSGGLVHIPLAQLSGARTVTIEVKRKFTTFSLGGLSEAVEAAKKASCSSNSFD